MDWRTSYFIGGFAGLALLAFRIRVHESAMFKGAQEVRARGKIRMIFNERGRFLKFLYCVFMVLPVWYTAGVLVTFGPELIKSEYGI